MLKFVNIISYFINSESLTKSFISLPLHFFHKHLVLFLLLESLQVHADEPMLVVEYSSLAFLLETATSLDGCLLFQIDRQVKFIHFCRADEREQPERECTKKLEWLSFQICLLLLLFNIIERERERAKRNTYIRIQIIIIICCKLQVSMTTGKNRRLANLDRIILKFS